MISLNLVIDVDGVLTTGQFLYSSEGKSHKLFGPHDSDGLKLVKDKLAISFLTADHRGLDITKKRIDDMGFSVSLVSETERFEYIKNKFGFDKTIFIGDGIHDVPLLKQCLFGIAPQSARPEARAAAHYVTPSRAGEGAVLDACLEIKERLLESPMLPQIIDTTERYQFKRLRAGVTRKLTEFIDDKSFHTLYVHTGQATIEVKRGNNLETCLISAGQGWYATPGTTWRSVLHSDADIFHVRSEVDTTRPIVRILDDGREQTEEILGPHGIISNPKRVEKPWGHELWVMWSRDYHVLKQISMKAGNQSSLQVHRHKLETNYLVGGQADVIDQLPINTTQNEELMAAAVREINLSEYKESKISGMHWTSTPGIVHRVIATTDYVAYETSTPELDDVVRLQDDTARASGRIVHEHQKHAAAV